MKKLLVFAVALLLCIAIMSPVLAEYGYTYVSKIPMAVDFTFRVEFDSRGLAYVVTDYPYQSTGATQMILVYTKDNKQEEVPLVYTFDENNTFIGHAYYSGHDTIADEYVASKQIQDGTLELEDKIYICTSHNNAKVDWVLYYSISKKAYVQYDEKTFSQGYNAMGAGGVHKRISYTNGKMSSVDAYARIDEGDLHLLYDNNGNIESAYVSLYKGANKGSYDYDKSTGRFGGKTLTELGFSENDINIPALAAFGTKPDPDKTRAFVSRCYQIILGRDADKTGLNTWYNELASGRKAAAEIIDQFVSSDEFKNKKLSKADAVEILYKAMLDRASDSAGKASWVAQLESGKPLQAVINGFCGSAEFGNLCQNYGIKPGTVTVPDTQPEEQQPAASDEQIKAYVTRCYKIILGRDADEGGLKTWVNELNSGRKAAAEIIDQFVISAEFKNKKVSNADAVEILYKAMLDRPSDSAGKASWLTQLESGKPLQAVINGFCGSAEFGNLCQTYGINPGTVSVPDTQPEPQQPAASNEKIQAFVSRCYKIVLGRDADEGGMNTWSGELASGRKAAAEIIEQLVASSEFQNKKVSNADAVEILYKAMLGRGSDAKGKADWVGKLEGGQPLTAVINGFCGSTEFKTICDSYGIKPGTVNVGTMKAQAEETLSGQAEEAAPAMKKTTGENVTKVEIVNASETDANLGTAVQAIYVNEEKAKEFIGRCYRCILGREASASELDSWISQMLNGSRTPDQIARGFLFSGEFQGRNIGNEELVKILYRVYLNREADADGLAAWTQKLNEGTSLQELLNTFSRTGEFKAVVKNMAN